MKIPVKNKLSYIWAQITNKNRVYGKVHTTFDSHTAYGRDLAMAIMFDAYPAQPYTVTTKTTQWLQADQLANGNYELMSYESVNGKKAEAIRIGEYSREQLPKAMAHIEAGWRREKARISTKQPFAAKSQY